MFLYGHYLETELSLAWTNYLSMYMSSVYPGLDSELSFFRCIGHITNVLQRIHNVFIAMNTPSINT